MDAHSVPSPTNRFTTRLAVDFVEDNKRCGSIRVNMIQQSSVLRRSGWPCLRVEQREPATVCRCTGHEGSVRAVALSPYGTFALSVGIDKTMRLWVLNIPASLFPIKNFPVYSRGAQ